MKEIILALCLMWIVPHTFFALVVTLLALALGYCLGRRNGRDSYDRLFENALRKLGGV